MVAPPHVARLVALPRCTALRARARLPRLHRPGPPPAPHPHPTPLVLRRLLPRSRNREIADRWAVLIACPARPPVARRPSKNLLGRVSSRAIIPCAQTSPSSNTSAESLPQADLGLHTTVRNRQPEFGCTIQAAPPPTKPFARTRTGYLAHRLECENRTV